MKYSYEGSFTVEASLVMSVVLMAVLTMMRMAYGLRDEVVGSMVLMEPVEQLGHNEEMEAVEAVEKALEKAGTPYTWERYDFSMEIAGSPFTGRKILASGEGGRWKLEIEKKVFEPENFLRFIALLDREEQDENKLQERNEAQLFND